LRADLTANSTDVVLDMIPVLNRMEPAQQPMPTVIPGAWNRTYNLQGELLESRSTDTDGIFTFNTNGIFAVSGLMLAVPEEPVGAGADWYFDTEDNGVVLRTRVSVLDITDEQISISATTSLLSANNNQLDSFEETATGLYSTNSLLVSSMDVSRSINFTTNQNVNNEPAIITGAWQSTETIREITQ